jgi:polyisoprenyl-teichoic acid--peptidoglycan teichoic acid transferase
MSFQKKNLRNSLRKKKIKSMFTKENILKKGNGILQKIKGFFAKSSIRSLQEKKENEKKKRGFLALVLLVISLICIILFSHQVKIFLKDVGIKTVNAIFGEEIPNDEHGLTNILILGIGGSGHDGETLTDSIIVASINEKEKSVTMLSIPRDFYVQYEIGGVKRQSRINEVLREELNYWGKKTPDKELQYALAKEGLEEVIEDVFGYKIQRYGIIDFRGFEKIVDAVGGITVDIEKDIYDSTYPGPNWTYTTFQLSKGTHTLDGKTALKYARSRHGSSDFDRSKRQKNVLNALRNKAIEQGVLTSPEKIRSLLQIFEEHFWSDVTLPEMISLAAIAEKIPSENIFSFGITDDPNNGAGGFLVTPDRSLYGGAFVLVPFLNMEGQIYDQIQFFTEILFEHRSVLQPANAINIYNTTKVSGQANFLASHLRRYGFQIGEVDNIDSVIDVTRVEYYSTPVQQEIASLLRRKLEAEFIELPVPPDTTSLPPIQILIGKDFSDNPYRGSLYRRPLKKVSFEQLENTSLPY